MVAILLKFWREILIFLLSVVIAVGVALYPKPQTVTVTKDRVVTVTKIVKPDGTVVETTTTAVTEKPVPAAKKRYNVGVGVDPRNYRDPSVRVGARLGDLPLFLTVGGKPVSKEIDVGVLYEF